MGHLAPLALAVALTACASKPPMLFGERMPKGCKLDEAIDERCAAWAMDRLLMTIAFRPYEDRVIADYVASVGNRLARVSGDHRTWTFRVLDDPDPQAFAWLGTTIYLQRGTLAVLRNEAELAAVLGHEMGHVLGGHAHESFEESMRGVERTPFEQSKQVRYDRDDEIQADEHAVLLVERAGYDPHAVETMLSALAGTQLESKDDPDATHPWWPERLARAQALITGHRTGELGAERYLAHVGSLVVGNDPRTIAIVGKTVVFGRAKLAVDLPESRTAVIVSGKPTIAFEGQLAEVWLVPATLARLLPANNPSRDDSATDVYVAAGADALLFSVEGPGAKRRVAQLKASVRAPRPAELAELHPVRVDLHAPRTLWSR